MNVSVRLDYENTLLGHQKSYKVAKKDADKGEINSRIYSLLHYVFDELLCWTPHMVKNYINWELIEWLNLTPVIKKIDFPPELDEKKDLFYVASFLYPDEIKYSKKDFTLQVYEKILNDELKKYPKGFFSSASGIKNLQICFQYSIQQKLYDKSLKDIYIFFCDTNKAKKFISDAKLTLQLKKHYDNVLDLVHDSLEHEEKNDFYYFYARFLNDVNLTKERLKNEDNDKKQRN